jgi:hypothetical protein
MDTEQTETDPQGSSTPTISIIDPVGVSINQLVRVLFRKPVPLRAWFGLGFMLFMTTNLMNIVMMLAIQIPLNLLPVSRKWLGGDGPDEVIAWYQGNVVFFWSMLLGSLLVLGAILTLLSWLRSRGIVMFLHGVATGNGNIPEAWAASKVPGNAVFLWRILISTLVLLGFLLACLVLWAGVLGSTSTAPEGKPPDIPVWSIVISIVIAVVSLVLGLLVNVIFDRVVVPAMYIRNCGARAAFKAVRTELLPGRIWLFIGFVLFQWGLQFASGTALQFIVMLSCCLAVVPYLGSVLALPAIFPLVAYQLAFYQQFRGKWVTLPVEKPPVASAIGGAPPTTPIDPDVSGPID